MAGSCVKVNCCDAISCSTIREAVPKCERMTDKPTLATIVSAKKCQNMAEVRAGVDAVDTALIALLAQRFDFMDAAARIKTDRNTVRDEMRKTAVLNNVAAAAAMQGLSVPLIKEIWDKLIEASIAHELAQWDRVKG
jgi:isochorismate pyruvate lyase